MSYEVGQVVDLTHNLTGTPITVTVTIVSYEANSKHVFIAPIKRAGVMAISETNIISCVPNSSVKYAFDTPLQNADVLTKKFAQNVAVRRSLAAKLEGSSNTSELARYMFASIDKSMQCQWDGSTIVVANVVRITSPYNEDSCESNVPAALSRVRRMVNNLANTFTPTNS